MADKIKLRRDSASNWLSVNPILESGEIGIESNTRKFKIGDGSTMWSLLAYASVTSTDLENAVNGRALKSTSLSGYGILDAYTKQAVDLLLADKINSTAVYTKTELNSLLAAKVNALDTINNLTSSDTTKPLSANQGKVLKQYIDNINIMLTSDDSTLDDIQEIVNYIKQNKNDLQNLSVENIAGLENLLINQSIINKPVITSPANFTTDYIGAVTSTYNTSSTYEGLQTRVIWECALDDNFNDIIDSYEGSDNLTSWTPTISLPLTQVFIRTKQISDGHRSDFSDAISFTTPNIFVQAPTISISGNLSGLVLTPTISLSAFSVFNGSDTHVSTDYQAVNKATGVVKWESLGNTVDKLKITTEQLDIQAKYTFRARVNGQTYGSSSWVEIDGTTVNIYVENPTITVNGAPSDVKKNPKITLSAFSVFNGTDTLELSDYQVIKVSDGTVKWESLNNTTDLLSITTGDLEVSTQYKFRARQKGKVYGYSSWVETTATTAAVFTPTIGIQGKKGFSVAPTDQPFALLGLAELTGTNDPTSDNYGNYIHTNGSIVCWLPKSYYRVGHPDSPRYAKYGENALDFKGTDVFATEAVANAAGYVLPRVFINAGKEQPGVFVDKYMNSKDGNTASKSVFGGVPISLMAATAGWTTSGGMTGCTGILADAVVLSRARGTRWNAATAFIYAYLAMVSVAQAQAATSTADVAWYDPTGVKNYPKGCNNNALSDVDDTTVVYASAGDSGNANKPKTGATAGFAKTTHNGSNNGVADVNGGLWEMTIGITNFGSSATATTAVATDQIYVLKQSVDVATLTGGWDGTNDVWGNTTNLATKYDLVTSPHPLGSATGAVYWGNGSNAVFQNDLNGVNRDVCGFIPKNSSSTNATGANLFGNDYFYKYNVQNMVPLACGYWNSSANAGVFHRNFSNYRSLSSHTCGFRASAYFA